VKEFRGEIQLGNIALGNHRTENLTTEVVAKIWPWHK